MPGPDESRDYDLDGLGNWRRTTFDPVGGSEQTQIRQHNSLNQITSLKIDGTFGPPWTADTSNLSGWMLDGVNNANSDGGVLYGTFTILFPAPPYYYYSLFLYKDLPRTQAVAGSVYLGSLTDIELTLPELNDSGISGTVQLDNATDENFTVTGQPKVVPSYDKSGNLLDDGVRKYEWDALNRLKKVYKTPSSPVLIGEYTYDALGRRIRKVVTNGGLSGNIPNGTTDFLYHSGISQCCEERDGSDDPFKQYVWGIYIDELLQMKTFATINGNTAGDYYPLSDTLYRTMALTDDVGGLVEAYDTDAYGNTLIFTAAGTGNDWWADDAVHGDNPTCAFIFTGRRYDPETGNYFYRARYDGVELGRFLSRDTAGYYGSGLNLYAYVHNAPTGLSDPSGRLIHRPLEGSGYGSGASNQLVIVGTTQTGATPADVLLAYGALALALIAGTVMVEAPEPIDLPDWEWQPRTRDCPRGQPRTTGPTIGPVPRQGQEQNCRDRHPSWDACPQNNILWPASVANSFLRVSCPNNPRLVITDCTPISNIAPACGHSGGVQYHCFVSEGMINPLPIVYRVSVRCCNCCSRGRQSIESRDCGNAHWSQGNRPPQCY